MASTSAPKGLSRADVALWRKLQAELDERGDWRGAAPELLEALVRRLADARMWREDIAEREARDGVASRYALGSTRQLVAHPSFGELRNAVNDAQSLADRLLLSPQSARRAKLGVMPSLDDELTVLLGAS